MQKNANNLCCDKKKFNYKKKKESAIQSLKDVEIFLRNFKKFSNYIKLYKLIK